MIALRSQPRVQSLPHKALCRHPSARSSAACEPALVLWWSSSACVASNLSLSASSSPQQERTRHDVTRACARSKPRLLTRSRELTPPNNHWCAAHGVEAAALHAVRQRRSCPLSLPVNYPTRPPSFPAQTKPPAARHTRRVTVQPAALRARPGPAADKPLVSHPQTGPTPLGAAPHRPAPRPVLST